jgi:hypothetical protein
MTDHSLLYPPKLFTIGYQKLTPEGLRSLVEMEEVDLVIDVRLKAWSEREEWMGHQLVGTLGRDHYQHWPQLGNVDREKPGWHPEDWGKADRATLQIRDMLAEGKRVLLLCLEHDPADCHRLWVAAAVTDEVEHVRIGE